uniref:Uncharacterized protein n=1 Tax=Rhizophora mucronata TaxID=61149 RepID=A0A2P2NYN6_RHIMU
MVLVAHCTLAAAHTMFWKKKKCTRSMPTISARQDLVRATKLLFVLYISMLPVEVILNYGGIML